MKNQPTAMKNKIADKALALAAGAMVLFFLSFIWVATQATNSLAENNAQDAVTCNGTDLIAKYAAEEPQTLAKIKKQAAETPNGSGIFWKIEKNGIPASWLMGTMHMADTRIAKLDGEELEAFNAARILVVENTEALDPAKAQAAMGKLTGLTLALPGQELTELLDEKTLELLKPAIESRGIPFAVATRLRPWLVATTVAIPACEALAKQAGNPVLDALLAEKAKESGKPIAGLETMEEQLKSIATLPQEFHLTALKETLELGNVTEDIIETMKLLYMKGEIGMVLPLMEVASPKTEGSAGNAQFQEQLILKRNIIMADRVAENLAKGGTFLAVGALHLPGKQGLVELIRQKGYRVTKVE